MNSDKKLTLEEKQVLMGEGWKFLREDYIYIPNDYDGCMAEGIKNIRRVLEGIQRRKQHENHKCKSSGL